MSISVGERAHEARFVGAVQGMLARPDFLIPLAAAERQFRDHYYGLNSAALLEDLFFDALGNFLRQTEPETTLIRPPTGQKGWDYSFSGLRISHKVSQRLDVVAALWDATKQGVTTWSFDEPIVYVLGSNTPSTSLSVALDGRTTWKARAAADIGRPYSADGRAILIVAWPVGRQPQLLDVLPTVKGELLRDALPFAQLWSHVANHVRAGGAANEIDVLVTSQRPTKTVTEALSQLPLPLPIDIDVHLRGGVYLMSKARLQNLSVTSNNRGILIPKPTVESILQRSVTDGLFAPLPVWYWPYAEERPPDMYSAQRAEYDALFSARLGPDQRA